MQIVRYVCILQLVIIATAKGYESYSAKTYVYISVLDVNENAPEIFIHTLSGGTADVTEVAEGLPIGTLVARMEVEDKDLGRSGRVTCTQNQPAFNLYKLYGYDYQVSYSSLYNIIQPKTNGVNHLAKLPRGGN